MTDTTRHAAISACGIYRYALGRTWDAGKFPLPIIMLNPSTADAEIDDPTIKRCMEFSRREGFGGIWVGNLFAYRATSPADMRSARDPIGPENDTALLELFARARAGDLPVLAAWGVHGEHNGRAARVVSMAAGAGARLVCLGVTKDGHPRHPLYIKGSHPFLPFGVGQ